jgi:hypothetical protein
MAAPFNGILRIASVELSSSGDACGLLYNSVVKAENGNYQQHCYCCIASDTTGDILY